MGRRQVSRRRRWAAFTVWAPIGVGYAFAMIGIASLGLLVLPVAIAATVVLARRVLFRDGLAGLVAGLGVPPLYVAYLNRAGPGNVCTAIPGGYSCNQELSPWPWVGVGVSLIAAGVLWGIVRTGHTGSAEPSDSALRLKLPSTGAVLV